MKRIVMTLLAIVLGAPVASAQATTAALLDTVQHASFLFFWNEANPSNGLIRDRSQSWSPCSIASLGFGLSSICVGVDHGWVTREAGRDRVRTALQTLWTGPQGSGASGFIGYKGFYYHFLDMTTATRTWDCELSTIDTALLFAGVLDCKQYFTGSDTAETSIRALADSIYRRADWEFFRNATAGLYMGWKPGTGFTGYGLWRGYNEAMILYILGLGSPTHAIPSGCWTFWTGTYSWQTQYGKTYVVFAPLFGHQYSHCWIDFRYIADAYMRGKGITYFENSRRATLAQRAYAIANPGGWVGYSDSLWGLTASDSPTGYGERGAPPAKNDEGTITPTAPVSSLPFAPTEMLPVIRNLYFDYPPLWGPYGFRDAFNLSVGGTWWDTDYIGIDQGPIVLMIENYLTNAVWDRFMQNPDIQLGLTRAGFQAVPGAGVEPRAGAEELLAWSAPNPFTRMTTIRFRLPQAGPVRLAVFDLEGRQVSRLVDGERPAGEQAATWQAGEVPSGVYYVRLEAGGRAVTKRLVRVR